MDELSARDRLRRQLKEDEGLRLKPYVDCCGKTWRTCTCADRGRLTIGYGRNLDDKGISPGEAESMLDNDIDDTIRDLTTFLPWAAQLDPVRQAVLVNMAFNLGIGGLLKFKRTLEAIQRRDWDRAAAEMAKSRWWSQVGRRAHRLRDQLVTGQWQ